MRQPNISPLASALLLVVIIAVSFVGCKHEPLALEEVIVDNGGGQEPEPIDTCDPNVIYFEQDVLPIFIQSCTTPGCHNVPTDANDEIQLTDHASITDDHHFADILEAITDNDPEDVMPPDSMPPLTAEQIAIIQAWMNAGAPNNSCESGCDTSNVTYAGAIRPIIEQRCLNCHSGASPDGDLDFSTWQDLNSAAGDGRLESAITHTGSAASMPPSGPMLSQCRIDQFMLWIQDGAPNN